MVMLALLANMKVDGVLECEHDATGCQVCVPVLATRTFRLSYRQHTVWCRLSEEGAAFYSQQSVESDLSNDRSVDTAGCEHATELVPVISLYSYEPDVICAASPAPAVAERDVTRVHNLWDTDPIGVVHRATAKNQYHAGAVCCTVRSAGGKTFYTVKVYLRKLQETIVPNDILERMVGDQTEFLNGRIVVVRREGMTRVLRFCAADDNGVSLWTEAAAIFAATATCADVAVVKSISGRMHSVKIWDSHDASVYRTAQAWNMELCQDYKPRDSDELFGMIALACYHSQCGNASRRCYAIKVTAAYRIGHASGCAFAPAPAVAYLAGQSALRRSWIGSVSSWLNTLLAAISPWTVPVYVVTAGPRRALLRPSFYDGNARLCLGPRDYAAYYSAPLSRVVRAQSDGAIYHSAGGFAALVRGLGICFRSVYGAFNLGEADTNCLA
jgi:hypothetical protein